jgi:diaminopimelate decarboxylase
MSHLDTAAVKRLAEWDGDRLERLAAEHDTPLYVTDLDRIRENFARFESAFDFAHVMYAVKANTGRAVVRTLEYDRTEDGAEHVADRIHMLR